MQRYRKVAEKDQWALVELYRERWPDYPLSIIEAGQLTDTDVAAPTPVKKNKKAAPKPRPKASPKSPPPADKPKAAEPPSATASGL